MHFGRLEDRNAPHGGSRSPRLLTCSLPKNVVGYINSIYSNGDTVTSTIRLQPLLFNLNPKQFLRARQVTTHVTPRRFAYPRLTLCLSPCTPICTTKK